MFANPPVCRSSIEGAVLAAAAGVVRNEMATAASESPESRVVTLSSTKPPEGTTGIPGQLLIQLPDQLSPTTVKAQLSAVAGVEAVVQNIVVSVAQGKDNSQHRDASSRSCTMLQVSTAALHHSSARLTVVDGVLSGPAC